MSSLDSASSRQGDPTRGGNPSGGRPGDPTRGGAGEVTGRQPDPTRGGSRPGDPTRGAPTYTQDVHGIQRSLQHLGYEVGPVDGVYGPQTEAAVRAFQRDNGMIVNGVVDPQTGRAMLGTSEFQQTFRPGMRSGTGGVGVRPGDPMRGDVGQGGSRADVPTSTVTNPGMTGGGSQIGPGPDASDSEIDEYIRENYGYMGWVLDEPELAGIMRQAVREGRDPQWIESQIMATDWFEQTEPARRQWQQIQGEDPARAEDLLDNISTDIQLQASRLGVDIHDERVRELANESIANGWADINTGSVDSERMARALTAEADFSPNVGGDLGALSDSVVASSHEWMVPMSDSSAFDWAKRITNGETTQDGLANYLRDQALSRFPQLEDHIERGVTPNQFFEPYKEEVARLLEMNPNQVDLMNDSRFTPLVDFVTEGGDRRPMTMREVQQYARSMPEWQTTRQAKEEAASFTEMLGQTFGRVSG